MCLIFRQIPHLRNVAFAHSIVLIFWIYPFRGTCESLQYAFQIDVTSGADKGTLFNKPPAYPSFLQKPEAASPQTVQAAA